MGYEQMIASGFEEEISDHANHEFMIMDELDEAVKEIRKVDPKYAMAIYLRKYIGLSREETANQMCVSARTVDHYVAQAVKIGKRFRKRHEQ